MILVKGTKYLNLKIIKNQQLTSSTNVATVLIFLFIFFKPIKIRPQLGLQKNKSIRNVGSLRCLFVDTAGGTGTQFASSSTSSE
jgi:hypothetical protein